MPGLYFDQFAVGQQFRSPTRTLTETDVVMFSSLSGDYNEIHTSETFAKVTPFGKRVVHGLLGLSICHGLMFRMAFMDGTGMALLNVKEWDFKQPIFFGDTIHAVATVQEKVPSRTKLDRGIILFSVVLYNQDEVVVQEGVKTLMIRRSETADR